MSRIVSIDVKWVCDDMKPSAATEAGWRAFDEGWSSFSNPYPPGSYEHDEWSFAWQTAEGAMIADREIAAGADPEDYK